MVWVHCADVYFENKKTTSQKCDRPTINNELKKLGKIQSAFYHDYYCPSFICFRAEIYKTYYFFFLPSSRNLMATIQSILTPR